VAFVLPALNGGGAERAALNLHHHSHLDTRLLVERAGGDLSEDPMAADAISLDLTTRTGRGARTARLARVLREVHPSVVVAVLSPLTVGFAAKLSRSRVIYWTQNPPYFIPGFRASGSGPLGRLGLHTLARFADVVASASPGLTADWTSAGVLESKCAVLPNGVELPHDPPSPQGHRDSTTLRLLSIGRLVAQKRHDLLVRALARIRVQRPAELTILGRGELEGDLRALAESLGVADHVHFPGFVTDTTRYLAASDIFVLASDFEGFGNVIVEALGHGLPVVCTDAPYGPRFIAGDCRAVQLVPPGDADAIARAALSVAEKGCARWAVEAHTRALAFSMRRVVDHFETLVAQTIRGGPLPVWHDSSTPFETRA
jgi:glycosyltransferase involved in cell wall biosynthesis